MLFKEWRRLRRFSHHLPPPLCSRGGAVAVVAEESRFTLGFVTSVSAGINWHVRDASSRAAEKGAGEQERTLGRNCGWAIAD